MFDQGAFYIFVDNGITNDIDYPDAAMNLQWIAANGLTAAGISGEFRFLDDIGVKCSGDHKFSAYVKNYRTDFYAKGPDFVIYNFMSANLSYDLIRGSVATVGWSYFLEDNVTEIAIPLYYLYPDVDPDDLPPSLFVAFLVNDAAAGKYFSTTDYAPSEQDTGGTYEIITNWYEIPVSTNS